MSTETIVQGNGTILGEIVAQAEKDLGTVTPSVTKATAAWDAAYKTFEEVKKQHGDSADSIHDMHEKAYRDSLSGVLNGDLAKGSKDLRVLFVTRLESHAAKFAPKSKLTGERNKIFATVKWHLEKDLAVPAEYYGKSGARKAYEAATESALVKARKAAIAALEARFKDNDKGLEDFWNAIVTEYSPKQ